MVTWGVLYYSFAVYLPQMNAETGWSLTALSFGFSGAILVSGLLAPQVGRWIDNCHARAVMMVGSVTGIIGVGLWAGAHTLPVYYAAWLLIGVAMAATFYEAAFATTVCQQPSTARRAISLITLAGGLASTVSSPAAQLLSEIGDSWRIGVILLAIIFAVVMVPIAVSLPRPPRRAERAEVQQATNGNEGPPKPQRMPTPDYRWLAVTFMLAGIADVVFAVYLVAFIINVGNLPLAATVIAGGLGVAKLAGRLIVIIGSRWSVLSLLRASLLGQAAALLIPLIWHHRAAVVVMPVLFGAATGARTILRPLLVTELWGHASFGHANGKLQRLTTVAKAAAPIAAGLIVANAGYLSLWLSLAVLVVVAAAATHQLRNLALEADTYAEPEKAPTSS
ncbi:MFS transporter [Mycobacterium sp.]|uniref:MFS transporter n=1 Tax=Mycobacterium sp. TaxID=1785 RepID=UPI003BAC5160